MAKPKKQRRKKKPTGSTRRARRRVSVSRDMPELQQARALWGQNHYRQALALFDKAVRKDPNNPLALVDAARAYGARFEVARAERLLDRLLELGGHRADLLHLAGQSYRMVHRPDRAIACFEQATEKAPDLVDAQLELAILYERRSRLDEALEQIDACLGVKPGYREAKLIRARILRRLDQTTECENLLRDLAESDQGHWIVRSQAWSDLGQLYDSQGQYDTAFDAVLRCKRLLRKEEKPSLAESIGEEERLESFLDGLTREHFTRWKTAAANLPEQRWAMLTGPPRSGTTLLERVLDSHPDVVSSDEREAFPKFVLPTLLEGTDESQSGLELLDAATHDRMADERLRYQRFMEEALGEPIGGRMHIDKNPSIVRLIPGMLRLMPECRLLIAIRDPRDVIVSCFMRNLPLNSVSVQYLTLERTARRYARGMEAWLKLREIIPSPWIEVRYEATVDDLANEARRALEFLGVGWDDRVLDYRARLERRQVNSPTYEDVAKPIYRSAMGRWKNYEKQLGPVIDQVDSLVRQLGYA